MNAAREPLFTSYPPAPPSDFMPDPDQPRKEFDLMELESLAVSIKAQGLIQPILVRPNKPKPGEQLRTDQPRWIIIAGERRWRASIIAALAAIPFNIKQDEQNEATLRTLQLVENVQRADLSLGDTCHGVQELLRAIDAQLLDEGRQNESALEIAASQLGKSKAWVSKRSSIFKLRSAVQELVKEGLVNDVEILHMLDRLADQDPVEFDSCLEAYWEAESEDARPSRDWLRDKLHELDEAQKRAAHASEGGFTETPQSGELFTPHPEDVSGSAPASGDSGSAAQVSDALAIAGPGPKADDVAKAAAKKYTDQAAEQRRAKAAKLAAQIATFEQEASEKACRQFGLQFDPQQKFNSEACISSQIHVNEFATTLPADAEANNYSLTLRGKLDKLAGAIDTFLPGEDEKFDLVQATFTRGELRKIQRVLGRALQVERKATFTGVQVRKLLAKSERGKTVSRAKKGAMAAAQPQDGATGVGLFLKACTQRKKGERVKCSDLHQAYQAYCARHEVAPLSLNSNTWGSAIEYAKVAKTKAHGQRYYLDLQIIVGADQ